jgi:DNA repair exonuclease SbcCD ATPase subunit
MPFDPVSISIVSARPLNPQETPTADSQASGTTDLPDDAVNPFDDAFEVDRDGNPISRPAEVHTPDLRSQSTGAGDETSTSEGSQDITLFSSDAESETRAATLQSPPPTITMTTKAFLETWWWAFLVGIVVAVSLFFLIRFLIRRRPQFGDDYTEYDQPLREQELSKAHYKLHQQETSNQPAAKSRSASYLEPVSHSRLESDDHRSRDQDGGAAILSEFHSSTKADPTVDSSSDVSLTDDDDDYAASEELRAPTASSSHATVADRDHPMTDDSTDAQGIAELSDTISKLKNVRLELSSELEQLQMEVERAAADKLRAETTVADLQAQLERLAKQFAATDELRAGFERRVRESDDQISSLKLEITSLGELASRCESAEARNLELENELLAASAKLSAWEAQSAGQKDSSLAVGVEAEQLKSRIRELENELQAALSTQDLVKLQNAELNDKLRATDSEINDSRAQIAQLENELVRTRSNLESVRQSAKMLEMQLSQAGRQHGSGEHRQPPGSSATDVHQFPTSPLPAADNSDVTREVQPIAPQDDIIRRVKLEYARRKRAERMLNEAEEQRDELAAKFRELRILYQTLEARLHSADRNVTRDDHKANTSDGITPELKKPKKRR